MAELLRKYGANVNATFSNQQMNMVTMLHLSIIINNRNMFDYVVALPDIDLSVEDGLGETALYKAVDSGNEYFVKALLTNDRWESSFYRSEGKNSLLKLLRLAEEKGFLTIKDILTRLNSLLVLLSQKAARAS